MLLFKVPEYPSEVNREQSDYVFVGPHCRRRPGRQLNPILDQAAKTACKMFMLAMIHERSHCPHILPRI